ncbi:hypothetical protein GDO78_021713 [Eleutherodactylus coqui]|uniref:Uncharacterized protein n=1 Tax=Eleutherodactylus coqui TaxID=57060 RepID=A0A8J6EH87_ELECQ|nr:hypothetical protein GDO78_021713 [Eleutherodactylus coqui]
MNIQAWGVCSLLLGVAYKVAAAASAIEDQNDPQLPFWSIILIALACILTFTMLICFICTICAIVKPALYPRNSWVRCYFPHLAFWGFDVEPTGSVP